MRDQSQNEIMLKLTGEANDGTFFRGLRQSHQGGSEATWESCAEKSTPGR